MSSRPKPRIIFLTTEDWYFVSHRLPMARAARDGGFEVGVATRIGAYADQIRAEGFALHPIRWQRGSTGLADNLRAVRDIAQIYRRERPDIVHHVAIKPIILGSLAASLARVPRIVNGLTGLGYLFTSRSWRARALRTSMMPVLRRLLRRQGSMVLVQNRDDRARLVEAGFVDESRVRTIRGSGVDIHTLTPLPVPEGIVTAGFVGRILEMKGIRILVEAQRRLRQRGTTIRILAAGIPDPENPGSIPEAEIEAWRGEPGIEWLGYCDDVRAVWRQSHIAVLPSLGGEGLPKSLLEAAACGRPLIATDIPGSREIAVPERNALLVPPGDAEALADALERLAGDAELCARFGRESRLLVESDMSEEGVSQRILDLYRELLREGR